MRSEQLLDCQADLLARSQGDEGFRRFTRNVLTEAHSDNGMPDSDIANNGARVADAMSKCVSQALAYRVTEDMSRMVQHVAETLDETDTFSHDLAPSPFGMVYFERPLPITDVRGRSMLVHWAVWGAGVGRETGSDREIPITMCYVFNDHLIQPDEVAEIIESAITGSLMRQRLGRWGLIGADIWHAGRVVGEHLIEPSARDAAKVIAAGDTPHSFTSTLRYIHALWMLLGQTVTSVEDEYVSKGAIKRSLRQGITPRVTVIRLRRVSGSSARGESQIDWHSRWLVRGHLRWQPYGSRVSQHNHELGPVEVSEGHSARFCILPDCDFGVRRIFIAPYVKGPEGKPLRLTEHVYELAR